MAKVTFLPSGTTVEVDPEQYPYGDHGQPGSLLDIALHAGVDIGHNCGGVCACTTCHVVVEAGEDHLSEMDDDEEDRLDKAEGLTLRSRLACVSVVEGSGEVTVKVMMTKAQAGGH